MNTYVITLSDTDGILFRYTLKGDYTPYDIMDRLAIKYKATHIRCDVKNQGWFLEKDYE